MLHKKRLKPEYILQCKCVAWFHLTYPDYIIFAVINEACYRQKSYFEKSGLLSGVSDLVVILPNKVLFIEMKSEKGKQRIEQKAFQNKIENLNQKYYICRNLETFQAIINNELN